MQKKAVRGKSHGTANELFLGRLGRDGLGLGLGLAEVGGEIGLAGRGGLALQTVSNRWCRWSCESCMHVRRTVFCTEL